MINETDAKSYAIAASNDRQAMELTVGRMMRDGWFPIGGLAVSVVSGCGVLYSQAMGHMESGAHWIDYPQDKS